VCDQLEDGYRTTRQNLVPEKGNELHRRHQMSAALLTRY
jgi:hypothetical protein